MLVLVVIIASVAGLWWWRTQGQPESVITRIERDLAQYEVIIRDCKEAGEKEKISCDKKFKTIETSLTNYERELKELSRIQMANINVISTSTATSTS